MSIAARLTERIIIMGEGYSVWSGTRDEFMSLGKDSESIESIVSGMMKGVS